MIQRIQSIWLLIVALAAFATYTLTLYIGKLADGTEKVLQLADDFLLVIIIIALGMLAIICMFLFKNRKLQFGSYLRVLKLSNKKGYSTDQYCSIVCVNVDFNLPFFI